MSSTTTSLILWLFVLFLGISFGAGVYEQRVVVPRWIETTADSGAHWNSEAARRDDTGRRFWAFVTTVPLTLLTLVNLWAAWRAPAPMRTWWLVAGIAALADRAITFGYFIPTMVGLMNAADTPQAVATAARWASVNYLRLAIVLVAWLAALKTFALLYQQRG